VEKKFDASSDESAAQLTIYLDPQILSDLEAEFLQTNYNIIASADLANYRFYKDGTRLKIQYPDGFNCELPYFVRNVTSIISSLKKKSSHLQSSHDHFTSYIRTAEGIEKKIFSKISVSPERSLKDLWTEIIKKTNQISSTSHTINSLVENILNVPFLQKFESSLIILHLKGATKAEMIGTIWRSEKVKGLIEVREFNKAFNSIRKSKIKSFFSDAFANINLPFNGSFLAKELISKKYSLIAVVSRHDFLNYSEDEISLFETCIDLLQPHFERLIDQEFSDKKISELRVCLGDFPLPLRVQDNQSESIFINNLFHDGLQKQDIFYSKNLGNNFSIDLYDSDELRHYAFDLFHFQRISLLGELLNTLRHELSNPLFGLKLSSQIFQTLGPNSDDITLMTEVEKNIDRCQLIMENFSNLYQVTPQTRRVTIKKIIDESLMLAKSEIRDVKKFINYDPGIETQEINLPLIFVVQILFNLIINSSQAMRSSANPPELRLHIYSNDMQLIVDVEDNGPGIGEARIDMLFKPFFTTKAQGTGLGLVLSRNLALRIGGKLEYINRESAEGALFRLTLPLV
jgi:two-component system, NtrC family, sensor kinase